MKVFYVLTVLLSVGMWIAGMIMIIPNAPNPHTLTGNWMFVGGGMLAMTGTLFLFLIAVVAATLATSKAGKAAH
jgi:hypothetical protein